MPIPPPTPSTSGSRYYAGGNGRRGSAARIIQASMREAKPTFRTDIATEAGGSFEDAFLAVAHFAHRDEQVRVARVLE